MAPDERDPLQQGQRTADEMEERLDTLDEHIGTAKRKAAETDKTEAGSSVAGDWEEESAGAHQGDDASEFDDPEAEEREED